MKKKKLTFVISDLEIGGAQRVLVCLANYFLNKGYNIKILVFKFSNKKIFNLSKNISLGCKRLIKSSKYCNKIFLKLLSFFKLMVSRKVSSLINFLELFVSVLWDWVYPILDYQIPQHVALVNSNQVFGSLIPFQCYFDSLQFRIWVICFITLAISMLIYLRGMYPTQRICMVCLGVVIISIVICLRGLYLM